MGLVAIGALTVGVYCACAYVGTGVCGNDDARQTVYNRMIDGFAKGQLSLDRSVPIEIARMEDPYDPAQNQSYRGPPYYLYDLSYYHGKLYAYFGPVPALLLFGPVHRLTGHYLSYKEAAVVYSTVGFLVAAWLLRSARRRYAPETPEWMMAMILLAVGLATGLPTLLTRVDIWEIPIAGATCLILCMVGALWQAWHFPERRARWVGLASLILGLAVGTRPTALLLAPVLILPLLQEWRGQGPARRWRMLACAALPFVACLGALGLYNVARFGNPLEFGQTFQLAAEQYVSRLRQYGFDYVWDNLRIYFLNFTPWKTVFPYVGAAPKLALHAGHAEPEFCFGIFANVPIAVLALLVLRVRRRRDGLAFLAGVVLWIAVAQIGLLMVFFGGVSRYEVEILTPLLLLAAIGMLAVEGEGGHPAAWRGLWIVLTAVSVAFNIGHAATHAAWTRKNASYWFFGRNEIQAALDDYTILILLEPAKADLHNARGVALGMLARWDDAVPEFTTAIRLDPGYADAQCNLGTAYLALGNPAAAMGPLQECLRLRPDTPRAREALALVARRLEMHGDPPRH